MNIKRNDSIRDWALGEIINNYKTEREGIHLTDLLTPRKKYFEILNPRKPTAEEIAYYTSGNAIEYKILQAIGYQKGEAKEWNGIKYSVDTWLGNIPAEIKTRRRNLAKEGEEVTVYEHYLSQLRGYCAIENKTKAWLIVLSMLERQDDTGKTAPEWVFYEVDFEENELEEERENLLDRKALLQLALDKKDHTVLPQCPSWMCGSTYKIMVTKPKCLTCDREFETDWGLDKHINGRKGMGHEALFATYRTEIVKKCRYFDLCNPDIPGGE